MLCLCIQCLSRGIRIGFGSGRGVKLGVSGKEIEIVVIVPRERIVSNREYREYCIVHIVRPESEIERETGETEIKSQREPESSRSERDRSVRLHRRVGIA